MIGHAYERLKAGKNYKIDLGIRDPVAFMKADLSVKTPDNKDLVDEYNDVQLHHKTIAKMNKALANGGLKPNQVVQFGVSPYYDVKGNKTTITGGTGNLALTDADRYDPGAWSSDESQLLYNLALGTAKDAKGAPITAKLGYQGRGAYTGFVDGRQGGQSNLMSTYRFKVPDNGRRWVPSDDAFTDPALGAPFGTDDTKRKAWGIIVNNKLQQDIRDKDGMYFQDEDTKRGTAVQLTPNDVVGYVHGLIQAVYDVEWHKATSGSGGTPYEIAVGQQTFKRSSCFTCSVFMEATGYPASSTHIGKGESWCIVHGTGNHTTQDAAHDSCNDKWALYCQRIINSGMACMVTASKNLLKPEHQASFNFLKSYLANKNTPDNKYVYGNLILDAVTVHKSEVKRVDDTIID
jgi:hypothetical protein